MTDLPDPATCPVCGRSNRCAMAAPQGAGTDTPCWCTRVQIAPEALAQIPAAARDKACLCAECARRRD